MKEKSVGNKIYEDMLGYDDPNYSSPRVKKGSNKLLAEERLTYKSNVAPMCFIDQITGNVKEPHELHAQEICVALKKLAKYEDAEEQGLLLKLPCKVGTTVYVKMASYCDIPYAEAEVRDFTHFTSCGFCAVIASKHFDKQNIPFSEFGKTVFLTKEQAEEVLKITNQTNR